MDAHDASAYVFGQAIEGLFVLEDLSNIGPDYAPTLKAWWQNFDAGYDGQFGDAISIDEPRSRSSSQEMASGNSS